MQVLQFDQLVPYREGWELQKECVRQVDRGAEDQLILLQHSHTVTLGRGSHQENLLLSAVEYSQRKIDVVEIDRGGDVTYHGPGQLVGYPIIYLGESGQAKEYLRKLEEALIDALTVWGIQGSRKESYTGVWVGEEKIAAIGVKFNRARHRRGYITSHGFALNVATDLSYFQTIVPCGIVEYGVTSLEQLLDQPPSMDEVRQQVIESFQKVFAYKKTASCQ